MKISIKIINVKNVKIVYKLVLLVPYAVILGIMGFLKLILEYLEKTIDKQCD